MCGRYGEWAFFPTLHLGVGPRVPVLRPPPLNLKPQYNAAPGQRVAVARPEGDGRRVALLRWGLVPSWAKDHRIGYRLINARAETVRTKPAFRAAYRSRRCLVPADRFYE